MYNLLLRQSKNMYSTKDIVMITAPYRPLILKQPI